MPSTPPGVIKSWNPTACGPVGRGRCLKRRRGQNLFNPEYHHSLWWGGILSLLGLPKGHFKACSTKLAKGIHLGDNPSAPPFVNPHVFMFTLAVLSADPHPHLKIVQKYTSADFVRKVNLDAPTKKKRENVDNYKCCSAQIL